MSEPTEACVRGCSIYRRHLNACEGIDDETCRGCLPRRAEHGRLCQPCHRRWELMLTDAETVHRWMTGNMAGGGGTDPEAERVTGSRERPLPIKADLFDLRELLADRLALWVDDWVEFKGLQGPGRHTVGTDAKYLLTWLPGVEKLDWIGDWWEELAEVMRDAHALAPWRPKMQRVPGVPCPGCEETNLVIWGGESDVNCASCRIVMSEDKFDLWQRVLEASEQKEAS